jgi:hypothetical protein
VNPRSRRISVGSVLLGGLLAGALAAPSLIVAAPSITHVKTAAAGPVACPLKPSSATPTGEAWAFTQTGLPATPHAGITSSYSHGRGTWAGGHGAGTICAQESVGAQTSHDLVLTLVGAARLSPQITRLRHLGAGLALNVKVAASDDQSCSVGERGTITLFASYYEQHDDSVALALRGDCSSYRYIYTGSQVHVLIADNGRQVN